MNDIFNGVVKAISFITVIVVSWTITISVIKVFVYLAFYWNPFKG